MKLLALDTSGQTCAACLYDCVKNQEQGREVLDLGRGHAEYLMGIIQKTLTKAGIDYNDLDAIGVSIGPGSFTGIRVGVSVARGLSLALGIPAIGVSSLEAVAQKALLHNKRKTPVLAAFDTVQGYIQAAFFDSDETVLRQPCVMDFSDIFDLVEKYNPIVTGSASRKIVERTGKALEVASEKSEADISTYARLAFKARYDSKKPKPLYLNSRNISLENQNTNYCR